MAAETHGFDILLTADQNLQYQRNLATRRIAVIVLDTNRWHHIEVRSPLILAETEMADPDSFQTLGSLNPDLG